MSYVTRTSFEVDAVAATAFRGARGASMDEDLDARQDASNASFGSWYPQRIQETSSGYVWLPPTSSTKTDEEDELVAAAAAASIQEAIREDA